MNAIDAAWLAGLLEGEGSFCVDAHTGTRADGSPGGRRPSLVVSLQMTDQDVVQRAAALMDGTCIPSRRRKIRPNESPSWRTKVTGQKAEDTMRAVLPLMGQRRTAKILECLAHENLGHKTRKVGP